MSNQNENALVQFGDVSVTAITNASGVFVGTNTQYGWASHEKENEAFGLIFGDWNGVYSNINLLFDSDLIDAPIQDSDLFHSK
ncbi:hypothetical protein JOD24_002072 [Kroppenstedtia sanguinis]|uniref:Uncharacterized protein n=1 Tax=Kroppenstedtia sanguinis TaxID=1380684 RepID=A0ABW4C568_9BACL